MALYTEKTLQKCWEIREKLLKRGYMCEVWQMEGGFISVRYCAFTRPDGSLFYAETLKDLIKEVMRDDKSKAMARSFANR